MVPPQSTTPMAVDSRDGQVAESAKREDICAQGVLTITLIIIESHSYLNYWQKNLYIYCHTMAY